MNTVTAVPVYDIDFKSPNYANDPFSVFRKLHKDFPIFKTSDDLYVLTRYEDVSRVVRTHKQFATGWASAPIAHQQFLSDEHRRGHFLTETDPPDHTHYSEMIRHHFMGKEVTNLMGFMEERAQEAAEKLPTGRPFDLIKDFAYPYCTITMDPITGFDNHKDIERVRSWIGLAQSFMSSDPEGIKMDEALASLAEQNFYFDDLVADRRRCPRQDLISTLANTPVLDGYLSKEQLRGALNLFTIGGLEAPVQMLGNACLVFSRHPELVEVLRDDPEKTISFVEELLRYDNTALGSMRVAKQSVEFEGGIIPEGGRIIALLAAANRDADQFESPDEFILGRRNIKSHLGFSHGQHACIGAAVARVQMAIGIQALVRNFSKIECPVKPTYHSSNVTRFVHELTVEVSC